MKDGNHSSSSHTPWGTDVRDHSYYVIPRGHLRLTVSGLTQLQGNLRVFLHDQSKSSRNTERGDLELPYATVQVERDPMVLDFEGLESHRYTLFIHHDLNTDNLITGSNDRVLAAHGMICEGIAYYTPDNGQPTKDSPERQWFQLPPDEVTRIYLEPDYSCQR